MFTRRWGLKIETKGIPLVSVNWQQILGETLNSKLGAERQKLGAESRERACHCSQELAQAKREAADRKLESKVLRDLEILPKG